MTDRSRHALQVTLALAALIILLAWANQAYGPNSIEPEIEPTSHPTETEN
ncbi:MAG: hypothetical protein RIF37_17955 [Rhodospirillaceae bacterium]